MGGDRSFVIFYRDLILPEPFLSLVPVIPPLVYRDACFGHTTPLLKSLSLSPPMALLAVARALGGKGTCGKYQRCPLRGSNCNLRSNKLPWCYEVPEGQAPHPIVNQIVQWWFQDKWVVRLDCAYEEEQERDK